MKNLQFLILALLLVSCETISGKFTALSDLTFKDGTLVKSGEHSAKLIAKKRSMTVELKDDVKIKFKVPKDADLPTRNGQFMLTSNQVNQPFDIQGTVGTTSTDSESRRDYERCTYREPHTICHVDDRGRQRCYTEYRDVRGYRNVQYRLRTENKGLSIALHTPGTNIIAGNFEGSDVRRFRVYEYEGICR